ncbi:MAG: sigma-70 family RNA polymerase sigma factor [Pseudomonadota bacterium]
MSTSFSVTNTAEFFFCGDSPMLPTMAQADPDTLLMLRYKSGELDAFETLYQKHRGPLYRYFVRNGQSTSVAEELYQEVWMKLIKSRLNYEARAKFSTYLYQLAHNCMVDFIRKQSRRPQLVGGLDFAEAVDETTQPDRPLQATQDRAALLKALDQLPDDQREVFVLKEEVHLNLDEIALVTGVGRETAKSRLRYANSKLKELMAISLGVSS